MPDFVAGQAADRAGARRNEIAFRSRSGAIQRANNIIAVRCSWPESGRQRGLIDERQGNSIDNYDARVGDHGTESCFAGKCGELRYVRIHARDAHAAHQNALFE